MSQESSTSILSTIEAKQNLLSIVKQLGPEEIGYLGLLIQLVADVRNPMAANYFKTIKTSDLTLKYQLTLSKPGSSRRGSFSALVNSKSSDLWLTGSLSLESTSETNGAKS